MVAQQLALTSFLQKKKHSWEAGSFSARKETLPTVHYPIHNSPINPSHNLPLYISTTDLNYFPSSPPPKVSTPLLSSYLYAKNVNEFLLYTI